MFGIFKKKKKNDEAQVEEVVEAAEDAKAVAPRPLEEVLEDTVDSMESIALMSEFSDETDDALEAVERAKEKASAVEEKPKKKADAAPKRPLDEVLDLPSDVGQIVPAALMSELAEDVSEVDDGVFDFTGDAVEETETQKSAAPLIVSADETAPEADESDTNGGSWFSKLRAGLSKTSAGISDGIGGIFTKRKLDDEMLEELEELLIMSDMGAAVAANMVAEFGKGRFDKEIEADEVKTVLAEQISTTLRDVAKPFSVQSQAKPHVMLVVGVNGNGKTTTMGKMAARLKADGYSVMMAAADTFRAAAVEQLCIWGERSGVEVVSAEEGADSASVAYRALEKAKAEGVDVLMIDTAGRLHNKNNLMEELQKISRVLKKQDGDAPHTVLQVLDGTTGQNAVSQVEAFQRLIDVNGLVVTKLDGTAKGGVVIALADKFGIPIHAVGVGEGVDDLRAFDADEFAKSLVGSV